MSKRIDPSQAPAKCIKHGITPVRGVWFSKADPKECVACACGIEAADILGVDVVDAQSSVAWRESITAGCTYDGIQRYLFDTIPLGRPYLNGLSDGWEDEQSGRASNYLSKKDIDDY
jgi:hypothetical protein